MYIEENVFTITFTNNDAANLARQLADKCIRAIQIGPYAYDPCTEAADSLEVEDNDLIVTAYAFFSIDLIEVSKKVIKYIANSMPDEDFKFDIYGNDQCDEAVIEGSYQSGVLDWTSTYYPLGYSELLCCSVCDEEIVHIEDYDPNKVYVCPKCGEELDFSDIVPVIEKELITIR